MNAMTSPSGYTQKEISKKKNFEKEILSFSF
jgi:hypothetical protein